MAIKAQKIEYFHVREGTPHGEGYDLLSQLAEHGVNLLAFSSFPAGTGHVQFVLFPESSEKLVAAAETIGLVLSDPSQAFLVTGDDQVGALVELYAKLDEANVEPAASHGIATGNGRFGYVCYMRPGQIDRAARALGVS